MNNSSSSSSKADRKTVEKNRRHEMKALFTKLNSLVLHQQGSSSRENVSLSDQIDVATKYIKKLQAHLERLKEKKSNLVQSSDSSSRSNTRQRSEAFEPKPPQIEVYARGDSALEVILITGLDCYTIFKEAIRVLHDEGIDIVNASFSVVDDTSMYHTIHGKIEDPSTHQGIVARITERLKGMMLSIDS